MTHKILALDLSMSMSGWALFKDGELSAYGAIPQPRYKGRSVDRYPKRTAKDGILMAEQVLDIIVQTNPDEIVIEEVSPGFKQGIKSIKGLCGLHFILLYFIEEKLDKVSFITPSEWRKEVGLKKNKNWKLSSVIMANKLHDLQLQKSENDISDAILLGTAYCQMK